LKSCSGLRLPTRGGGEDSDDFLKKQACNSHGTDIQCSKRSDNRFHSATSSQHAAKSDMHEIKRRYQPKKTV
jgi:hypothetical protein